MPQLSLRFFSSLGSLYDGIFVVSKVDDEDQPLVFVNDKFLELTGYTFDEVIGRNCRFLQGKETDLEDVQKIKNAIFKREAICCDIVNYTKLSRKFLNRLVLLPVTLDGDEYYFGIQHAISKKRMEIGEKKCSYETSELIKDKINNPLMKIYTYLSPRSPLSDSEKIEKIKVNLDLITKTVLSLS